MRINGQCGYMRIHADVSANGALDSRDNHYTMESPVECSHSNRIVLSVGVDLKYPSSPIVPALPPITLYNSQVYTTHGSRKETQNFVSCMPRLANSRLPIINTFMTSQLYVSHRECKAFSSLLCIRIFTL